MLHVVDVGKHLLLVFFVELLDKVYGIVGVKVWVYKGDNFGQEEAVEAPREDRRGRRPGDRAGKPGARRNNGRRNEMKQQTRKPAAAKDGE